MIKTREPNSHSARLRIPAGIATAEVMDAITEAARRYGRGQVYLTTRLGIEIPGVSGERFPHLREFLAEAGVRLAGCGPRMRSTVPCKGTVCSHGNVDTFDLAWEIDLRFNTAETLPHKFKVGVAGCASTCSKPQLNDVGLVGVADPMLVADACTGCGVCEGACHLGAITIDGEGLPVLDRTACVRCGDCCRACPSEALPPHRTGIDLYVGGRWGRRKQIGLRIARFLTPAEAVEATGRVRDWYASHGTAGERLGATAARVGPEPLQRHALEGLPDAAQVELNPDTIAAFRTLW